MLFRYVMCSVIDVQYNWLGTVFKLFKLFGITSATRRMDGKMLWRGREGICALLTWRIARRDHKSKLTTA